MARSNAWKGEPRDNLGRWSHVGANGKLVLIPGRSNRPKTAKIAPTIRPPAPVTSAVARNPRKYGVQVTVTKYKGGMFAAKAKYRGEKVFSTGYSPSDSYRRVLKSLKNR